MRGISFILFLGLLTFATALSAKTGQAAERVLLDQLEASVNSAIILHSDVQKFREVEKLRTQLDPTFSGTSLATKGPSASQKDIVDYLIDERLIAQEYPKTDDEVKKDIKTIQSANNLTQKGLEEALSREGYKYPDYFELIRDSGSKRDLIDRDIRTKVSITDDDVKNYFYNQVSKDSPSARAFHLQMITISNSNYKTPVASRQVATQALKDLRAGESFEEVAKRVSDDASAQSGGDIGTLTEDQMSPLIRKQALNLKIGEISGLFEDGPRVRILKLVDLSSSENDRFNKMKEEIRNQLITAEYQHQIALWLERQKGSNAFIHRAGEDVTKELPVSRGT